MIIKTLNQSYTEQMKEVFDYCFFGEEEEEPTQEDIVKFFKNINSRCSLGYFDGDKLVSTFIVCNYDIYIREVLMKMAGVEGVATLPEYRKQRLISAITKEALKIMREEKLFISALYPFKYSFYRKFGYEICCQFKRVESKPYNILLPVNFQPLKVKELTFDESLEKIKNVREIDGRKYTYIIFSDLINWISRNKHTKNTKIHAIMDSNDKIVGYFISFLTKKAETIQLVVDDYNVENEDAFLTLLDFIKKHTDQIKEFRIPVHNEDCVFDYFDDLDSNIFHYTSVGGAMFRIVDIEQALKLLNFPEDLKFSFSLQVKDDYAPWNNEPLMIKITNKKSKISKIKNTSKIDLQMDILAFTQLFIGYRSIENLAHAKKASIKSNLIELIDKAFPKRKTYTSTIF